MFRKIVIWKLYKLDGQSVNEGLRATRNKEQNWSTLLIMFFFIII